MFERGFLIMDRYSLYARLYPVIVLILPFIIVAIAFSIDLNSYGIMASSLGISAVLAYFLSNICRELGKKKEEQLWKKWGGMPTSQILSYENRVIDNITKKRYHNIMMTCVKETFCPNIGEKDKNAQVEIFRAWTKYIIENTRDTKKYPLIFKENIAYGFRRNLWAMKGFEFVILSITIIGNYICNAFEYGYNKFCNYTLSFYISETVLIIIMIIWIFIINESWIKTQAFTYAERLMEAIGTLEKDK